MQQLQKNVELEFIYLAAASFKGQYSSLTTERYYIPSEMIADTI